MLEGEISYREEFEALPGSVKALLREAVLAVDPQDTPLPDSEKEHLQNFQNVSKIIRNIKLLGSIGGVVSSLAVFVLARHYGHSVEEIKNPDLVSAVSGVSTGVIIALAAWGNSAGVRKIFSSKNLDKFIIRNEVPIPAYGVDSED